MFRLIWKCAQSSEPSWEIPAPTEMPDGLGRRAEITFRGEKDRAASLSEVKEKENCFQK